MSTDLRSMVFASLFAALTAVGALIAIPIVASIQAIIETYGRRYELIPELAHHEDVPPQVNDNDNDAIDEPVVTADK